MSGDALYALPGALILEKGHRALTQWPHGDLDSVQIRATSKARVAASRGAHQVRPDVMSENR